MGGGAKRPGGQQVRFQFSYREHSAPWFGYQKVLKGGAWATRSRLANNTYRNFYLPHRADILAGFRTCAK